MAKKSKPRKSTVAIHREQSIDDILAVVRDILERGEWWTADVSQPPILKPTPGTPDYSLVEGPETYIRFTVRHRPHADFGRFKLAQPVGTFKMPRGVKSWSGTIVGKLKKGV